VTRAADPQPVSVRFDRPFLFFIYDEPTGQILFAGRVRKP
jgi:serpin B